MPDEDIVNPDTPNGTADDATADDQASDTETNEDAQDVSADEADDAEKLKELNKKLFERAKKAEAEVKELKKTTAKPVVKTEVKPESSDLSQTDLLAVIRANVHDEDLPTVKDYAVAKKITVAEALKSESIKLILKEKEEERKSSQVANTGGSRRTTAKLSDESLLEKAKREEIPDSEMDRLVRTRLTSPKK